MKNNNINALIYSIAFLFLLIGMFYYLAMNPSFGKRDLGLTIEIANTPEAQSLGLSYRKDLCDNCAMLFVFDKSNYYNFWMKDMNFDLDIIYLDSDKKVVDIFTEVQKESYPNLIVNTKPAQYVLEINSGKAKELNLKLGDKLKVYENLD